MVHTRWGGFSRLINSLIFTALLTPIVCKWLPSTWMALPWAGFNGCLKMDRFHLGQVSFKPWNHDLLHLTMMTPRAPYSSSLNNRDDNLGWARWANHPNPPKGVGRVGVLNPEPVWAAQRRFKNGLARRVDPPALF